MITDRRANMVGIERRRLEAVLTDVEQRGAGKVSKIRGYAAVFDRMTHVDSFREVIRYGAFDNAHREDIRALLNHNPDYIFGRTTGGTLSVRQDRRGLYFEATPPDVDWVHGQLLAPIERGDITGCSFAFKVNPDGERWGRTDDGKTLRELISLTVFDVSVVTFPAYVDTVVTLGDATRGGLAARYDRQARLAEAEAKQWPAGSADNARRLELARIYRGMAMSERKQRVAELERWQ